MAVQENMKKLKPLFALRLFIIIALIAGGIFGGYLYGKTRQNGIAGNQGSNENIYASFSSEVYDKIKENYWDKIDDEQLSNLFRLGAEKISGQTQSLKKADKENTIKMIEGVVKQLDSDQKKKEFTTQLTDMVLANLNPFGRSRLYSQKEEKDLANNVNNVNPNVDYYQTLGIDKNATQEQIEAKYLEEKTKWDPQTNKSPEAAQKFDEFNRAYKALGDSESRKVYDAAGIEPTIDYRLINPKIFYMHIKKFSPTTFDELQRVATKVDTDNGPDTLILDLRDNIGGAIDGLPYFLGPFIGQDQYAYQFFHQGEKEDFRTRTGWLPSLVRYKKVVILINEGSQSSAEVMAAVLKRYNVGVLVGTTTKGWGTIEKVFPLTQQLSEDEKFSLFLVHSLTLRDDNQPIEGKGVEPVINVKKPGWEKDLYSYFQYEELTQAVKDLFKQS